MTQSDGNDLNDTQHKNYLSCLDYKTQGFSQVIK